jgi:hypothetical protein
MKAHTTYTHDIEIGDDTITLDIPFPFEEGTEVYQQAGDKIILSALCLDDCPSDPLEEWEEGEFYQFASRRKHYTRRPEVEDFKRTIRANPGRVVLIYSRGDGYFTDDKALIVADTKGETCYACEVENADGYYIAPEDVTDPASYAKGAIETYSAWCTGDVWGILTWTFDLEGNLVGDDARNECWGFYGCRYALEEMQGQHKQTIEEESK